MTLLLNTDEKPDAEIKKALAGVIADAAKEWSPLTYEGPYPVKGFGITELRPYIVGLSQVYWSASVTTAWADWISHTLGDSEYVVVTGIMNLTPDPATTGIQPKANGQDLPVIHVESMGAYAQGVGFFSKPFAVRANNKIVVQIVGRTAQTERLGLVGYEVAKRATLISQTP